MKGTELELAPAQPVAAVVAQPAPLSLQQAWQDIKSGDFDKDKLAVMKELIAMNAQQQFAVAKTNLQSEMPKVQAMRPVPNRDGSLRYKFAPFEDIMEQVSPLLQKHGFTVSFSTRYADGRLIKSCTLQHIGGHKETNEFAVRVGGGPPGATETQADGAAGTYAKRFALCDCLNIVIEKDSDAGAEGAPITAKQAEEIERRVALLGERVNMPAFWKFAKATKFSEIPSSRYADIDEMLAKKEQAER